MNKLNKIVGNYRKDITEIQDALQKGGYTETESEMFTIHHFYDHLSTKIYENVFLKDEYKTRRIQGKLTALELTSCYNDLLPVFGKNKSFQLLMKALEHKHFKSQKITDDVSDDESEEDEEEDDSDSLPVFEVKK